MAAPIVAGGVLAAFLAALVPVLIRFAQMYAVKLFVSFLARLGIALATHKLIIQPLIDRVMSAWNVIPPSWQCWFSLLGVTKVAGIMVSFLTLVTIKRVFFAKTS